jgi:hypothetical protein
MAAARIFLKIFLILCTWSSYSGCSGTISPDIQQDLTQFNDDLRATGRAPLDFSGLIVAESALCPVAAGRCTYGPTKLIEIDRACIHSRAALTATIYHEVGHCYFNLKHSEHGIMASPIDGYVFGLFLDADSRRALLVDMLK